MRSSAGRRRREGVDGDGRTSRLMSRLTRPDDITTDFVPVVDGAVAEVVLDGEVVLYHEGANTVHVLNRTASIVWQALDGTRSVGQVSAELAPRVAVSAEDVGADVLLAVQEFGRQGLLAGVEVSEEALEANRVEGRDESEAPGV